MAAASWFPRTVSGAANWAALETNVSVTTVASEITAGLRVTVTGVNFGASQGSGNVYLSQTNTISDADKVTQTIVSWSNTSILFTVTRGALPYNTNLYLFVKETGGTSNADGSITQIKPGVTLVRQV